MSGRVSLRTTAGRIGAKTKGLLNKLQSGQGHSLTLFQNNNSALVHCGRVTPKEDSTVGSFYWSSRDQYLTCLLFLVRRPAHGPAGQILVAHYAV